MKKKREKHYIVCGWCDLLYGVFPSKEEVPKSFVCPVCKVAQQTGWQEMQKLYARRRNYPEEYFENQ